MTEMNFLNVDIDDTTVAVLETAKYLKNKGVYKGLKRVKYKQRRMNHNKYDEFIYSAPTQEQAFKWLKNNKNNI